jgi:hypothetical protein
VSVAEAVGNFRLDEDSDRTADTVLRHNAQIGAVTAHIVPWTGGYVHSWALRWMLSNSEAARDALFTL